VLVGLLVAACGIIGPQSGEDDPSAPILFTAQILNIAQVPPGTRYQVQVFHQKDAVLDESDSPVLDSVYKASGEGTFDVHFEPTPKLRSYARVNGRPISFMVFVSVPGGDSVFTFTFDRDLGSDSWAGEPLVMEITPDVDDWHPRDQFVPPLLPAGA
jgi:hypothetical protein